jgi:hypothetical protein
MEALVSSETLLTITQRHIPQDRKLYIHRRDNLKTYTNISDVLVTPAALDITPGLPKADYYSFPVPSLQ